MLRALSGVICALALIALAGCTNRRAQEETPNEEQVTPVGAQAVTNGSLRAVIHASGVITPAAGAEFLVTSTEPATIAEITKNAGDPVTSGEMLVRFDIAGAADIVGRQRAEVARLQAALENARIAQARARDLAGRGFISRREMEDADREVADAQAAVTRAESARSAAEAAAARAIVRAPFNGIVTQRLHNQGDLVKGAAVDPVLRIVDPRRLEITASVPLAQAARVLPGATARLATAADAPMVRLTVATRPSPGTTPGSDYTFRLTFVDAATLPVDTTVEVDVDAEERTNVVLVPIDAVIREGGSTSVFVAAGDRAQRRTVTTGLIDEERIEITSGLKAGELLIVRGQGGLSEGAAISVDLGAAAQP
jgi:RND family efflux transporter MFP subunit